MLRSLLACAALLLSAGAVAQPRIAVADLTYKDTVREHFSYAAGYEKSSSRASMSTRDSDFSSSERASASHRREAGFVQASGTVTRIEYGELRKFTADLKGELIRSQAFRIVQARPYTDAKPNEQIFDIINRIKRGAFPGADYVLFGTVSSVEWRNDQQPVQDTRNTMLLYSLELGVDFSLINTKTYQVHAAFSAVGEGSDSKIWSAGARLTPNRARVMQEVSRSLAEEALQQIDAQFKPLGMERRSDDRRAREDAPAQGQVTVYQ
ncbi:penicillin-binding protein activator LpoB [Imbroritus primus]|uniref:Penicillin-binding protein activator LpoB n=1 Tax=Imbroritus primus TaxID=3058603 RepID=A0ACD3SSD1_9BURK|nr:penicillin-binding protein activator LpoB [Burkholderiaceae bacterium PBA]